MATPNFFIKNVSRYFVIGSNQYYTQEQIDEEGLDQDCLGQYDELGTECNLDDDKSNVQCELEAKGWDREDGWDSSEDASVIASKDLCINYGGCEISLTIKALLRHGYYEAACFDLTGEIEIHDGKNGYYVGLWDMFGECVPNELDVIDQDFTGYAGLNHIQARNIIAKINNVIEGLKNEAELAFSMYSEYELNCAWRACNGEAGYREVTKKLWQEVEEAKKAA